MAHEALDTYRGGFTFKAEVVYDSVLTTGKGDNWHIPSGMSGEFIKNYYITHTQSMLNYFRPKYLLAESVAGNRTRRGLPVHRNFPRREGESL